MAWRPHGRAQVDPDNPRAWATCDRCSMLYNLNRLHWQSQWAGHSLINLRLLVCDTCLDVPAQFLRTPVLPPDPPPVFNARVEPYSIDETDYRVTDGSQSSQLELQNPTVRVTDGADIDRVIETDTPVTSPLNNTPGPQPNPITCDTAAYTADNTQITADNYT